MAQLNGQIPIRSNANAAVDPMADGLPSPSSSQRNLEIDDVDEDYAIFGHISSSSGSSGGGISEDENREEEGEEEVEDGTAPSDVEIAARMGEVPLPNVGGGGIRQKAYSSHREAVLALLEKEGADKFLPNWNNDDIMGLLIQLSRHIPNPEGLRKIAQNFRDTSIQEIIDCIEWCREINKRASREHRFHFNDIVDECRKAKDGAAEQEGASTTGSGAPMATATTPVNREKFSNWCAIFGEMKKMRRIADESPDVLAKFLEECAAAMPDVPPMPPGCSQVPNYRHIYMHLLAMARGFALRKVEGINAAVMLDIFEQMQRDIESMPALTEFFRRMFNDMQSLNRDDFMFDEEMSEQNAGEQLMNPFSFPPVDSEDVFSVRCLLPEKP